MVKVSPLTNLRKMDEKIRTVQRAQNNKAKDQMGAALVQAIRGDKENVLLKSTMQLYVKYCKEQKEYFNQITKIQEECQNCKVALFAVPAAGFGILFTGSR